VPRWSLVGYAFLKLIQQGGSSSNTLKWVLLTGALYFGVGTAFNMKKLGKSGMEAIPNIEFW
jgi:hypothetical protein